MQISRLLIGLRQKEKHLRGAERGSGIVAQIAFTFAFTTWNRAFAKYRIADSNYFQPSIRCTVFKSMPLCGRSVAKYECCLIRSAPVN